MKTSENKIAHLLRVYRPPQKMYIVSFSKGFPGGSDGKASACNVGDPGSIPGSRRSPGEGNGNPLQYSCLENSMDGGDWYATVHGVTKNRTRQGDFTVLYVISVFYLYDPLIHMKARIILNHAYT